jgi:hypothetical protein
VLSGALHMNGVVQQVKVLLHLLLAGTCPVDWIDHGVKKKVRTGVIEQNRKMANLEWLNQLLLRVLLVHKFHNVHRSHEYITSYQR